MVYKTARDPSYSKPFCDLCRQKIDQGDTMFVIEDGSPIGEPPSGSTRHEGHFCQECDPTDELRKSIDFMKFECVGETIAMAQIFSKGQNNEHRYLPEDIPEPIKDALDEFIEEKASTLSY